MSYIKLLWSLRTLKSSVVSYRNCTDYEAS